MGIRVAIDASRNRSGGAKAHLVGILRDSDPREHGIEAVHVWSYKSLLAALPKRPWLVKHNPAALERGLAHQMWWQWRHLPREIAQAGCQVLLSTDAGSICRYSPSAVMSRDMLSYEPGEMQRYGFSMARLRLLALKYVQNRSLRLAEGAIFLTRYAAKVIQENTGRLPRVSIIPHGVGDEFKAVTPRQDWPAPGGGPVECLYVSNAAMYKHQWHVVRAVTSLRRQGHDMRLRLVGGGSGRAQALLEAEIARSDPHGAFVRCEPFARPEHLPGILSQAHLFIFASSCENMPNTLVEAMAAGLPIACSNRGPMPEVLGDGGVTFDPEAPDSIAAAIEALLRDDDRRRDLAAQARRLAENYSWSRCGRETWQFLSHLTGR